MIKFTKVGGAVHFEFNLLPKCIPFMHNYGKYGEPYRVYGGYWCQSKICADCSKVTFRNIGFIQSTSLHIPIEPKDEM